VAAGATDEGAAAASGADDEAVLGATPGGASLDET